MTHHRRATSLLVALVLGACLVTGAGAMSSFLAIDLGTLGGTDSSASAVNDSGQVVGESSTADDLDIHAFSWTQAGGMVDLGTLGGTESEPFAVNASGQVVGYSYTAGDTDLHAFSWTQAGGMVDLGILDPEILSGTRGYNVAVNASGQVIWNSHTAGDTWSHAFFLTTAPPATDPPVIHVPGDMSVPATLPSGSAVTYSVSAVDAVDGPVPVTCAPESGSIFPIGTTTVHCTATDRAGNSASSSFKVIVNRCPAFGNEVAGMIAALIAEVDDINLKKREEKKLIHELDKALKEVGQCDQKHACERVKKLIKEVQKKKIDKHFEPGEEAALLLQANAIRVKLGCS